MAGPSPLSSTGWRHISGNRWQRVVTSRAGKYTQFQTQEWRAPTPPIAGGRIGGTSSIGASRYGTQIANKRGLDLARKAHETAKRDQQRARDKQQQARDASRRQDARARLRKTAGAAGAGLRTGTVPIVTAGQIGGRSTFGRARVAQPATGGLPRGAGAYAQFQAKKSAKKTFMRNVSITPSQLPGVSGGKPTIGNLASTQRWAIVRGKLSRFMSAKGYQRNDYRSDSDWLSILTREIRLQPQRSPSLASELLGYFTLAELAVLNSYIDHLNHDLFKRTVFEPAGAITAPTGHAVPDFEVRRRARAFMGDLDQLLRMFEPIAALGGVAGGGAIAARRPAINWHRTGTRRGRSARSGYKSSSTTPKSGGFSYSSSTTAPTGALKPAKPISAPKSSIGQRLLIREMGRLDRSINQERARVAQVRDDFIAEGGLTKWYHNMRGSTKHLYNLMERRHVLNLQKNLPESSIYEQVKIMGIRTANGQLHDLTGKGRIADWCELKGDTARLGDIKSSNAIVRSVGGGMSNPAVDAVFRPSAAIARQHEVELGVISKARNADAKIVLQGRDPMSESTVTFEVHWSKLRPSRVAPYMQLSSN